jgi:hypothetical protein
MRIHILLLEKSHILMGKVQYQKYYRISRYDELKVDLLTGKPNSPNTRVQNAAIQAKEWLGDDYTIITNSSGGEVFISNDGLRRMRFDIKNPCEDNPHIHLEEYINGKWRNG